MWRESPCATCSSQFVHGPGYSIGFLIQEEMQAMPRRSVCARCPSHSRYASARARGPNPMLGGSIGAALKPVAGTFFLVFACIGVCVCVCVWSVQSGSFALLFSVAFSGPNFHKCSCQLALAVPCLRFRGGLRFLSVV